MQNQYFMRKFVLWTVSVCILFLFWINLHSTVSEHLIWLLMVGERVEINVNIFKKRMT